MRRGFRKVKDQGLGSRVQGQGSGSREIENWFVSCLAWRVRMAGQSNVAKEMARAAKEMACGPFLP